MVFPRGGLAAGCLIAAIAVAAGPARADLTDVGRAAAVNQRSEGTPPGAETRRLLVGSDVFFEERIVTSGSGQTQILFTDESSLTVGPNAEIVIDSYVFDPQTGEGELAMNLVDGVLRYVGGRISKGGNVSIQTPTATIGIRGGINLTTHDGDSGETRASNVFGHQTLTRDGTSEPIQRGWTAVVGPDGGVRFEQTQVQTVLDAQQQLEGGGGGGAEEQPTDEKVAESGIDESNSDLEPDLAQETADTGVEPSSGEETTDTAAIEDDTDTTESIQDIGAGGGGLGDEAFVGAALVDGLGGPAGFGERILKDPSEDAVGTLDGRLQVDVTPVFENGLVFGGRPFETLFVSNNGYVAFEDPGNVSPFDPFPIDGDTQFPLIAAYFADTDTRSGPVQATPGGNSTGANLAFVDVDEENGVITATWDDVGFFPERTDKLNAFQLQLVKQGAGDYDIVLRYEDINWTTSEDSGGTDGLGGNVARAGFSANNGVDFFELPQSGDEQAMLALPETTGNTGEPGLYVAEVRTFGDGRILATPDSSYVNDFDQLIGNPFGDNFLGDRTDDFDVSVTATQRTSGSGLSLVSFTAGGVRLGLPSGEGVFEVPQTQVLSPNGGVETVSGNGFVDSDHRFLLYALSISDGEGLRRLDQIDIDPTATFLQTGDSDARPAQAIALSDLNAEPGDVLVFRTSGDFVSDPANPADVSRDLLVVFSGSDTLLGQDSAERVPDAIDAGIDADSFGGATDIPEDFGLENINNVQTVVVPDGATHVFVASPDGFPSDNSDPDGDLGVEISTYLEGERLLFFSGVPTPNGSLVESAQRTVTSYDISDDVFTGAAIPFLPPSVDDAFDSPYISDFLIVRRAGEIVTPDANGVFPGPGQSQSPTLQASLAIEGQGVDQKSFILLSEGALGLSTEGKVHVAQGSRGSVRFAADDTPFFVFADVNTQANASGDHFFGEDMNFAVLSTDGISDADTDPDLDFGSATLSPLDFNREQERAEIYSYHHVIEQTETPASLGETVTFGELNGYVGALGQTRINSFPAMVGTPHILANETGRPTDVSIIKHDTNTVSAVFQFADPLGESVVQNAQWAFGGAGTTRGTLVDDQVFGARNSNEIPSDINGDPGFSGEFNLSGHRGLMVSSETLFPDGTEIAGTETCRCEFLTWGFWSGQFSGSFGPDSEQGLQERVHLGTWVAGDLPEPADVAGLTGTASYVGHAIGEVASGGSQYVATGRFRNTWDFAQRSGNVEITDFDGRDFSGAAMAPETNARDYSGAISGPDNIRGQLNGSFFQGGGDPAAATGGVFAVGNESGYRASGTFAATKQ